MRGREWLLGLALLSVGLPWIAVGGEPDPVEVRRLMEKYKREVEAEASKSVPASKPPPKPRPKRELVPKPKLKPAPTVNFDHEAWKSAEHCGTAACYEAYLVDYPKGRYAKMARARLKSASEPQTLMPVESVVPERPAPLLRPSRNLLVERYRDNSDGTVTDVQTKLQWMRCSLGQTWQGESCSGEAKTYGWQAALDAAAAFNYQGGYAGYRDWRAPEKQELQTLIYCSSGLPKTWNDTGNSCEGTYKRPTLYQSAFPNMDFLYYWSASAYATQVGLAWRVNFYDGDDGAYHKANRYAVRLVRGGQ